MIAFFIQMWCAHTNQQVSILEIGPLSTQSNQTEQKKKKTQIVVDFFLLSYFFFVVGTDCMRQVTLFSIGRFQYAFTSKLTNRKQKRTHRRRHQDKVNKRHKKEERNSKQNTIYKSGCVWDRLKSQKSRDF